MSNLLLNECHPGAHVLLLGLEMSAPCCMIEPTQGDWRVVRSVKLTVVVLNARGGVEKTQSTTIALHQFHPHVFLWRDDQGNVPIKNPFNTEMNNSKRA